MMINYRQYKIKLIR